MGSARNVIFKLRIIMERVTEVQKDLYLCFVDYSKTFEKVRLSDLFNILQRLHCDGRDLRVLRNLYWEQEAAIRVDNEYSEYKPICRGVREGCVFPQTFLIYSEMILRNIEQHDGITVGGYNVNNLWYADDTVLIADSEEKLQDIIMKVTKESENKGFQLNARKTECMVISKRPDTPICNVSCKGQIIQVNTFKYLGFKITPDTKCHFEIKKRIARSKDALTKMKTIFTNRNIRLNTKFNTIKTYAWSILLYGCECWTLTKNLERRLEAVEVWFIRRNMRISRTTNEEVIEMARYKRSLLKIIRARQMKFFEHIMEWKKQLLCGKICGMKSRERQRINYTDSLNLYITKKESPNNELIKRTGNREEWRAMVVDVWNRPGTWRRRIVGSCASLVAMIMRLVVFKCIDTSLRHLLCVLI